MIMRFMVSSFLEPFLYGRPVPHAPAWTPAGGTREPPFEGDRLSSGDDTGSRSASVAEADPEIAGGGDGVGVDGDELGFGEHVGEWHADDLRWIERDHGVEAARGDQPHGGRTEAQRQQAVERGGAAAALQVA